MSIYPYETTDGYQVTIEHLDKEKVLFINERTLLTDVSDDIVSLANMSKNKAEEQIIIDVQLKSVDTRKTKQLLNILQSIHSYFDLENILVLWHYEATDDHAFEQALQIQQRSSLNFSFHVFWNTEFQKY